MSPAPISLSTSLDLGDALVALRIGGVDHVQQQIGIACLGQGRTERRDQFVRQVADETDRVGEHDRSASRPSRRRTVGSSVANSWSAAYTVAPVSALNSVDLPALV